MFSKADVDRMRELADLMEMENAPYIARMRAKAKANHEERQAKMKARVDAALAQIEEERAARIAASRANDPR